VTRAPAVMGTCGVDTTLLPAGQQPVRLRPPFLPWYGPGCFEWGAGSGKARRPLSSGAGTLQRRRGMQNWLIRLLSRLRGREGNRLLPRSMVEERHTCPIHRLPMTRCRAGWLCEACYFAEHVAEGEGVSGGQ
jgi:hypothetical protein